MIERFCLFLVDKMKLKNPEIDDERAEVISYGLQLIIGEIPKMIITISIAYILGILKLTLITVFIMLPYRASSGGFHLKTHIGCILSTTLFYCGIPKISNYIYLHSQAKIICVLCALIFGIIIINKYAPADTENVPIISKKERNKKKILSYITYISGLIVSLLVINNMISNIIILGYIIQTMMITPIAYKITKNKYGHEIYDNSSESLAQNSI